MTPLSSTRRLSVWPHPLAFVVALILCEFLSNSTFAADKKYWDLSSYRIQIHLAVNNSTKPQVALGEKLLARIRERIQSTLYPVWDAEIAITQGPFRFLLLSGLDQLNSSIIDEAASRLDKQLYLCVQSSPTGYKITCREYDCYLHRWGPVRQRTVRQEITLSEQCFDLLRHTFAPLATIRPIENESDRVTLRFKGRDLPRQTAEDLFTETNDVFQPMLVRTSSSGEVRPEDVKEVPWTILSLLEPKESQWVSQVYSGIRTPFGLRRRGRVEHMAIATRHTPGTSMVRFHARHDREQALSGYEVFRKETPDKQSQLLGLTSADGIIEVPSTDHPVSTLFLRSDGQLLAKIPVAPGAATKGEVPVADDPARLRAQASLESLREKLIDLVARRTLLSARVRERLEKGKLEEARQLYSELDGLPGRASFDQQLSSVENNKLNRSEDAKIQARIDKMFSDTRKLLGRFLGAREISDLQNELNAAIRNKKTAG
ncbi:MAG TPA: hypothetical protein DHW22_12805 [Planctomycetaceae bacterium]|nr:hypothetical protein [Planctomycetaceae bacterium]